MRGRRTVCVLVATGALALAGCGDDSSTQTADDGSADTALAEREERAEQLGESVLTFTATTVGGEEFDAAELAGRPAVFWFWAPWCSTCMAEASHVVELAEEQGDAVSVVGVAGLSQPPEMEEFIELTETGGLTHLNDEEGEVWRQFQITAQSTFALVDAEGQITYSGFLGPDELDQRVAELTG